MTLAICFVGLGVSMAAAQTIKADSRVTLGIDGATVWLGMSQSDAMSELGKAGIKPAALDSRLYVVSGGTMQFTQGRLTFANREWTGSGGSEMNAVVGALGTLGGCGGSQCVVQNALLAEPEQKVERVFVTCGMRSILIMAGTANGKVVSSVAERIGHFDPTR